MRAPSRQMTRRLVAGALRCAATARARSAQTRPSAPSATPVTANGRPGSSISAGERAMPNSSFQRAISLRPYADQFLSVLAAMMKVAHPPEHSRVDILGHAHFPRDPREQIAIRKLDQALEIGELHIAQLRQRKIGEAAHNQVHLAHAAMPASKQELTAAQIKTVAAALRHL